MTKSESKSELAKKQERIARCLKAGRFLLGMNQAKLGAILGLDQSAYSRCESGKQQVTAAQWLVFLDLVEEFGFKP